ncbi:MAG: PQQ-binding-like beta-propeller repeat protein [Candidatus Bathyarchaeia archaeon]
MSQNKIVAAIALILLFCMIASFAVLPLANAHTPPWQIPTYAYIVAAPNPVGVGQTVHIYMWLDAVYGAAGGTTAVVSWNASTASTALIANNYRFHNYKLTITDPDGKSTTQIFDIIWDTTSNQYTKFIPDKVGTYTLKFEFPGQVYGENGNGYEKSSLMGDTYLPSSATTTLIVQEQPIPNPLGSTPLPTNYWTRPIYGEGTDWWVISSNWLGSGSPVLASYTSSTLFHPDAIGPLTAHIMWTRPLQFGGVVGGNMFVEGGSYPEGAAPGVLYFEGTAYQPRFVNPIIISGFLYYTEPVSFTGPSSGPLTCVDLRTGEVIWSRTDIPPLSFGYIYNLWNPDQHGTFPPILVSVSGTTWQLYDAYTDVSLFNVTNVPSGTAVAGPSGEQLRYVIINAGNNTNPRWYLSEWNSSKLWQYDVNPYTGRGSLSPSVINASNGALISTIPIPLRGTTATMPNGASMTVPYGSAITVNANIPINKTTLGSILLGSEATVAGMGITTYDWNISLSWLDRMSAPPTYNVISGQMVPAAPGTCPISRVLAANTGDSMLCLVGSLPTGYKGTSAGAPNAPYTLINVNLNASRGEIGQILWQKTYDPPAGNITMAFTAVDWQTRVFVFNYEETINWVGYDLDTGDYLWTTPTQGAWDYYGVGNLMVGALAYGKLITSGFSGVCYCFDDRTGKLLWTYGNGGEGNSTIAGLTVPYGVYPTFIQSISNGVVYLATNEHTIPNPIYKGSTYRAINATDGTEIWQLSGYPSEWSTPGSAWAAADGYLTCMNGIDNQIYCIGRGPSATTISAPQAGLAFGQPVVLSGTVMDISAGTKQKQQAADFPNGVPCASDAIMKDWMGYVYQQKPLPENFVGVNVTLSVLDSNNNYYVIGTATTDANGFYSLVWTPQIPGKFTVYATFAGTNSYWPSQAETAFTVMEPPAATPEPTPAPQEPVGTYFAVSTILIIAAIAVAVVLLLRKR